jgi:transglutaminase-like putative cysteine protease
MSMFRNGHSRVTYDIKLAFAYRYSSATVRGHHLLRLRPRNSPVQRLRHSRLLISPSATEISEGFDFFGNDRTFVLREGAHDNFTVTLEATVDVMRAVQELDLTPPWQDVITEAAELADLDPSSPCHFLAPSRLVPLDGGMTALAAAAIAPTRSIFAAALAMTRQVHEIMAYVPEVTGPRTDAGEAFALREGVCQDFAHVMIAGLRGLGIPAAYVSGLIRTIPPDGQERLEGADAMHAWVDVWCGEVAGWIGFDPTNALVVGNDHVEVAIGRDYADVAPIDGVIIASTAELKHAVDMVAR